MEGSILFNRSVILITVGWGCRIYRLLLFRGVRPPPNECPGYDTKQSDGEISVMLGLWGMRSTPSLPSLRGPLWSIMVALDRVLSMGQIFVTASHQTGLDTRSMTRRSIKVGIRGEDSRTRAEARNLLDYDAARPPEGGPAKSGGLMASSQPLLD